MILVIRFLISNEISRFIRVRKFLTERSKWFLNKVFNLTPQMREFQALSSLHDIPILPIILNPLNVNVPHTRVARPAQLHEAPLSGLDEPIRNFFTSSYNHSQLQAIDMATRKPIDGKDFELTLIQGPPGLFFSLSLSLFMLNFNQIFAFFFLSFFLLSTNFVIQVLERHAQLLP